MRNQEMDDDFRIAARQFPGLSNMFEQLRSVVEDFERMEEESARQAQAREEADEARAEKARSGELGPEWQRIQKRIDQGQTTLLDVFTGKDTSPEARSLQAQASKNLGRIHDQWAKEAENDDAENPLTELRDARKTQEARVHDIRGSFGPPYGL